MKFGLKESNVEDIVRIIAAFPEVQQAILYGSRAKGNYKAGSDIDLVLLGEALNMSLVNKISLELDELYLPYTFDISMLHQIDNVELVEHIARVGITLYGRIAT